METADWSALYGCALRTAESRLNELSKASTPELIACGFTSNVDRVVELTEELVARLMAETTTDVGGPRRTAVATPDDLVTAIVQAIVAGEGIDLPVSEAGTQDWLLERAGGRLQLGGTGAQAANTLARLGFPTLLHHTGLSPVQASVFEQSDRILVPGDGGVRPLVEAVAPGEQTMWHVALEHRAGLTIEVDGRAFVAPQPNRVIVSYDPVNAAFSLDRAYLDAVERGPHPIRRMLISGFSQIVTPEAMTRLIAETRAAIRSWRQARPGLVVHLELGAMPRVETLAGVVETLGPEIGSIGLNVDELRDLMLAWGESPPASPSEWPDALRIVRRRCSVPRLGLHTLSACLTLTDDDPERERAALLFASLVASTRARIGTYPTMADLAESLAVTGPNPRGIDIVDELGLESGIGACGDDWLVAVPTIAVPEPAATVGLGDSFTGGLLAIL